MAIVPNKKVERIQFYETHLPVWTAQGVAVGLQPSQLQAFALLVKAARNTYTAQQAAKEAALAATRTCDNAVSDMQRSGADLIATIKAFAETTNNPNVYTLAQIPAPASPTPAGPPVAPTNVSATMNSDGTIKLTWKGTIAQRQFFSIWRQLPTQTTPTQIGAVAAKDFTDVTVPRGLTQVVYSVRAHRDTQVSTPSENLVVYFGAIPGGGGFAAMVDGQVIGVLDPVAAAKRKAA